MAPDYPSDLIQEIKIRLRQAAGVPSYDPGDPSLPSIPSVADAVAALDPTLPDYLRCKRCHGGLFRGINSTLCIFCGAEQRGDGISRKIAFNSTASYRKMLQSLDLDDSEVVNLEAESKDSSKSQDSPKDGVTLANILNLELRWPREVEEIDRITSNEAPSQVAPVSLSGVDLDNFFSDQKNEVSPRFNTSRSTSNAPRASSHGANSFSVDFDAFHSGTRNETAEQFMPREQVLSTHINLSSRSQKLGFLEGRRSLDVVNSSADAEGGNSDDAFADWETDFQSASSAALEAKSKQIDPAESSQDFQSANPAAVTAESRTMNLLHNPVNYQSADHEAVGTESTQIDPFQNSSDFQPDNPSSLAMEFRTNDLFENSGDFQSANSEAVTTDSRPIDLIMNSAGFQSANLEAVATDSRDIDQFQNSSTDFSPIIVLKSDQNTNIGQNSNKNVTGKDPTQEVDHLASGNDRFQDDMWSQISTKTSKKTDQLESSSAVVGELQSAKKEATLSVYWSDDDLWQSSANEINNTKSLNHDDDGLFDDWQDFTTATNAPGNSTILQSSTNDMDLALPLEANSGDLEDLEFGCFMQSDSFSVALNDPQSSNHINIRQGGDSIAQRANQSNEKKTGNASAICSSSDISEIIPDASNYKVDKLVAQMPDLSFMLEESLYVPKIKPGPGPGPGHGPGPGPGPILGGSELNT